MKTISQIQQEIAQATARRSALWAELGRARDSSGAAEAARLTRKLHELWEELRIAKARTRSGPPELIVQRAARERRLDHQLEKDLKASTLRKAA